MYSRFESEISVRPDDIDFNNHLHFTKYLDYVLAARYDQMARCYGMAMDEFLAHGFNWVVKKLTIEYKRAVLLGETVIVATWIEEIRATGVSVGFQIMKKENRKIAAEGVFEYLMIDTGNGKVTSIPQEIISHYSI